MRTNTRRLMVALAASLALAAEARAQPLSDGWRLIDRDNGVLISTRQLAGETHPTFRGQATISGAVLHVLAVVLDSLNAVHWVKGASEIALLREPDERTQYVQMITDLPWPIRDRETIMKRTIEVITMGSAFRVRYRCAPDERAPAQGKVRVRHCNSHFDLRAVEPNKTYVDYQVQIDPGGGLPNWSVRWMEKRIAADTLAKLAKQVARTRGKYAAMMQRWASER